MQSRYARFFQIIIILGDLLLLNGCYLLAGALRFDELQLQNTEYYDYYVQLAVFFNFAWLLLAYLFRTYDMHRTLEPRKVTAKVINVFFVHLFILLLLLVSLKKDEYSRLFLTYFYISFFVTILPWRFYFLRFLRAYRKRGSHFRPVLLIGSGAGLLRFYKAVQAHPEYGLEVAGYFSDDPVAGIPHTGSESEVSAFIKRQPVDELFCAYPSGDSRLYQWLHFADDRLIRFRIVPDLGVEHASAVEIDFYHDVPILVQRKEPLEYMHNRLIKRFGDVALSLLIILLIFPWLFPILILGVKMSGKGPVFFKQKRTGLKDGDFSIYKFRSMTVNSEADQTQAVAGDARITPFGRFIRKHNLDELPQFFNVLKGEMSVVGPRPHMLAHTEKYTALIDKYMVRHFTKPGITGLAQVSGLRGETRATKEMEERVKTDVYYIENWSVLLDVKIVLLTVWNTITGRD